MASLSEKPRSEKNTTTDERVKLTNEQIECIQLIKMYAWEYPIKAAVEKPLLKEISVINKI